MESMRAAVTSVLTGGVKRVPFAARVWMNLMFLGIGFDRWRRRLLRLPPTEAAPDRQESKVESFN